MTLILDGRDTAVASPVIGIRRIRKLLDRLSVLGGRAVLLLVDSVEVEMSSELLVGYVGVGIDTSLPGDTLLLVVLDDAPQRGTEVGLSLTNRSVDVG